MSKVVDKYVVLEEIGSGQFSTVHKGRHLDSADQVAIKILNLQRLEQNPKVKELIEEELRALKMIDSPYIVKNIKMMKTTNNMYEIYEFCEEGNLYGVLQKQGSFSEKNALTVFKDLVMAIKALHSKRNFELIQISSTEISSPRIFS